MYIFIYIYTHTRICISASSDDNIFSSFFVLPLKKPWLVWLSGLSARLGNKGSQVQFPVGEHAWVAGQVASRGHARSNHTLMFLSLSFSFPSPLSKNK